MLKSLVNKVARLKACNFFKNRLQHRCFPEYTVYMLDLLRDFYNCFLLSLIEKHLNLQKFFIFYWEKFLKLIKFITILLIYCFWILLSTFSVFLNDFFFRWLAYKSLLNRFSVLIILCDLTIFYLYPAIFDVFHGSGFLRSRFFRVHIPGLVPGFKNSPTLVHIFL